MLVPARIDSVLFRRTIFDMQHCGLFLPAHYLHTIHVASMQLRACGSFEHAKGVRFLKSARIPQATSAVTVQDQGAKARQARPGGALVGLAKTMWGSIY